MSELSAELVAATTAMLSRLSVDTETPATGLDSALWHALTESGFTGLDVPAEADGQGADLTDALAVLTTVVEAGALTPFIEHSLLASWLAGQVGYSLSGTTATVAVTSDLTCRLDGERAIVSGTASEVVFADVADRIVVHAAGPGGLVVAVLAVDGPGVTVENGTDLMGVAVAEVAVDEAVAMFHAPSPVDADAVRQRGALVYAAALAAAANAVDELTVRHASERIQFGRPLSKFQAIQQRLASLAAQASLMETAARVAAEQASADPWAARVAVAAAKVVTSRHAHTVASAGHQIHGAMGFTSEHRLGRSTTSLWTWRDRHGTESDWAEVLAAQILDEAADPWDLITGTRGAVSVTPRPATPQP